MPPSCVSSSQSAHTYLLYSFLLGQCFQTCSLPRQLGEVETSPGWNPVDLVVFVKLFCSLFKCWGRKSEPCTFLRSTVPLSCWAAPNLDLAKFKHCTDFLACMTLRKFLHLSNDSDTSTTWLVGGSYEKITIWVTDAKIRKPILPTSRSGGAGAGTQTFVHAKRFITELHTLLSR